LKRALNPSTLTVEQQAQPSAAGSAWRFFRVGGLLTTFSAVRQVAFFTRNAQGFGERWRRRLALAFTALGLPFLYAVHRRFATRLLHTFLRGVSRDRLDLLGEEYFQYVLRSKLKPRAAEQIKKALASGERVVLVSHGLDHVVRPMAKHLGVEWLLANRMEFRDGLATGRLLDPVIPPRGIFGFFKSNAAERGDTAQECARSLGLKSSPDFLQRALLTAERKPASKSHSIVLFRPDRGAARLSPRESLQGKNILLVGGTGFIGKVWLANLLTDIPDVGKVYLLIRRQRSATASRRFEKIVEESPVFDPLHERHGAGLADFLRGRIEVLEGDVTRPNLGLDDATCARLAPLLDLVVNSAGLTDFNPELRIALAANVDGMVHLLNFIRRTDHAALLHLSTCYVVGERDGRVAEELRADYTPGDTAGFEAEQERQLLHATVQEIERRAEGTEVTEELKQEALKRTKNLSEDALQAHLQKYRTRWIRAQLVEAGMRRAKELGWQNTYCFTKSLGESMIAKFGADLPVAVVRPSITETSTHQPFRGWNEGVNTSAPLSYLLGTFFRQLPSNERKCLDLIPVDLVARGMTLIAAALVERRHQQVYQLATSACNPCDMRRSIELTCLAHRKHYRAQEGLEHWLRARFDTIPVSKERYQRFSAPRQRKMVRAIRRFSAPIPFVRSPLVRKERDLERLEKLIELYEPFILHNEHVFEAQNIEALSEALPPEEKATFGYDAHAIDWWEYWINIHVPALRRWTYPLIEGKPLESRPRRPFHLDVPTNGGA
jgi:fatty acyl-CoA reductase